MDYERFLKMNPVYGKGVPYTQKELDDLGNKMPDDLVDFFKTFGRCSFNDGVFNTVYPNEIDSNTIFEAWGFKKGTYIIFLRTVFGACVFYYRRYYYFLDPARGEYQKTGTDLEMLLNYILTGDIFVNKTFMHDIYVSKKDDLPKLKDEEIYMLVPAIPFGGSFETSKFEPGNMFVHLCFLAQMFGNKAAEV